MVRIYSGVSQRRGFMKKTIFLLILVSAFALSGCATTQTSSNQAADKTCPVDVDQKEQIKAGIAEELKVLGESEIVEQKPAPDECDPDKVTYDIPIVINAAVEQHMDYFQKKIPKRFKMWLERSGRFTPMMRAILKEHGMPEDLVYLALIESGFNCDAYSRAAAVGPWQFIRGTGRRYGLRIDYWVDERRDPVKSTHAAAKYLGDLYAEFGSWYLAAAGYNAGEGKVRRALKRYKADDFWSISQGRRYYLKRETRQYVPKMIAAAIIGKNPEKYGFKELNYWEPLEYDTVTVHSGTSLGVAAKLAGIKTKELVQLNPELQRWCTPPTGMYSLNVPKGQKLSFEQAYAKLSEQERKARIGMITVKVHKGDTMGRIARSHRVRLSDLLALNPHINPRRMRIGQKVYVPPSSSGARYYASAPQTSTRNTARALPPTRQGTRKIYHTVKKGDSLWDIAQSYNLNWQDVKRWNGRRSSRLKVGDKLVLYVPQAKAEAKVPSGLGSGTTYIVRRGDNLWTIARTFGVSTTSIKQWNSLRSNRLDVGDKLIVYPKGSPSVAKAQTAEVITTAKAETGAGITATDAATPKTYQVQRGDTLWDISRRFNISTSQLKRLNGMRSNRLMPGDVLNVR